MAAPVQLKTTLEGSVWVVQWTLTAADFTGLPWTAPHRTEKFVQVTGTFNTGNVQIEGALDPVTPVYAILHTPQGLELSGIVAGMLRRIDENVVNIRPVGTAGLTSVLVTMLGISPRTRTG